MIELGGAVAGTGAAMLAALRWLLVAQREHYLAGAATRFAMRWWFGTGVLNAVLAVVAIAAATASIGPPLLGLAVLVVAFGPLGFPRQPRAPGPLAWTRRLRTLAAILALIYALVLAVGWALGEPPAAAIGGAVVMPMLTDLALAIASPIERALARRWIDKATTRLRHVGPTVVGITGSFGKTSTKNYVAHLAGADRAVVASPRSYNNAAGLAIAVNDHLLPGTEVFVAEMGTYGPGEIAAMREWVRPSISVITAIGPVHLERMRTEDRIVEAKSEILEGAAVAVLNVDDARLAALADRLARDGATRVVRCSSSDPSVDLCARRENGALVVYARGDEIARVDGVDAHPGNVACAAAVAIELGVAVHVIAQRLPALPAVPNRLTVSTASTGATAIDDTFNSNPAGAAAALELAVKHATPQGKLVVVTPGMVELGPRQHEENAAFARAVAARATHLVVVGRTNARALRHAAGTNGIAIVAVRSRQEAVDWVRANLGEGDVVLWENDLPDHYP